jgi:hypothetical protein
MAALMARTQSRARKTSLTLIVGVALAALSAILISYAANSAH